MTLVQGEQSRSPRHSTLAAAVSRTAALSVPGCGSVHLQHFHASRRATAFLKPGNGGSKTLRQKAGKDCSHNYLSNSKTLFVFALLCAEAQTGREVKVILFFLPLDPGFFWNNSQRFGSRSAPCAWTHARGLLLLAAGACACGSG